MGNTIAGMFLALLLAIGSAIAHAHTATAASDRPAATWSAERKPASSGPSSSPGAEVLVLTGKVEPQTHQAVIADARRLFPLIDVNDQMQDDPEGESQAHILFALRQLAKLTRGVVTIVGGEVTITGKARDVFEYAGDKWPSDAVKALPQGLRLGKVAVVPPSVADVSLFITKAQGRLQLAGYNTPAPINLTLSGVVPSTTAKAALKADTKRHFPAATLSDKTVVVAGAPENLVTAAKVGLDQLTHVTEGTAWLSGTDYSIIASSSTHSSAASKLDLAAVLRHGAASSLPAGYKPATVKVVGNPPPVDARSVDFMFATDRVRHDQSLRVDFNHERAAQMTFGIARVHVPDDHKTGRIELPGAASIFFWRTPQLADPHKHFIIKSIEVINRDDWKHLAAQHAEKSNALIFVHGYNTDFEAAVYRTAQVIWDLKYKGTAILFSWPSSGGDLGVAQYEYDRNSALFARAHFIELLKLLEQEAGIRQVSVIAHSMGDFLVLDALYNYYSSGGRLAIDELVMAAPDIDRDQYRQEIPDIRGIASGLTLYASSDDRAMQASRTFAQAPRAGDVISGVPTVTDGVDAIDVTAVGDDLLGLNHDTFASNRSVIDDISLVLRHIRPPDSRLGGDQGRSRGRQQANLWRYAP